MSARRDFARVAVAQLGLAVVNALMAIILVRITTQETLGSWFLISSLSMVAMAMAVGGIGHEVVRRLGEPLNRLRSVVRSAARSTSIPMTVVTVVLVVPAAAILSVVVDSPDASSIGYLTAIVGVVYVVQRIVLDYTRGLAALGLAALLGGFLNRLMLLIFLALFAVVSSSKLSVEQIVALEVGAVLLAILLLLRPILRATRRRPPGTRDTVFTFRQTIPLGTVAILTRVVMQADLVIAALFLGSADVAIYGISLRLSGLVALPLRATQIVTLPLLMKDKSAKSGHHSIRDVVVPSVAISLLVVGTFVVVGRPLLDFLFGAGYQSAYLPMLVLALGQLLNATTGPAQAPLVAAGHDRVMQVHAAIATVVLVVGCSLAGAAGSVVLVAVASSIATLTQQGLDWNSARTLCGTRTDPFTRSPALSSSR